jgi:proton-translocating NADH-quinone oxidoreductase chain N
MDSTILKSFIPEIFLSLCILFQLFLNSCLINNIYFNYPLFSKEIHNQIIFILFCLLLLLSNNKIEGFFVNFLFLNDFSCKVVKIFIVLTTLSVSFSVVRSFKSQKLNFFEFFIIFFFSLFATLLIVNASDMLSVYLVIELQTLSFYVLASFRKNSAFSIEAGLKYFIFGSFISGIFLLGCTIMYTCLGTLNFNNLSLLLSIPFSLDLFILRSLLLVGILLITIVLLFKIVAVPFHFWAPDVYEGAPLATTILFSIIPKFSIFYLFFKWISIVALFFEIKQLLLFSGLLSIFFGSFFAIRQRRVKKFVIYSSIAQIGFLVSALINTNSTSFLSIFFFLIIYIITSILIWSHISLFFNFQNRVNYFEKKSLTPLFLSTFSNLFLINKVWAISFLIIFFSLSGIPPLSGFLSKILVLYGLIIKKNVLNSFLLLIVSALSVFYYLRVIKIVFFEEKNNFKIDSSQIIFYDSFFEKDCLLISLLLFSLFFLFFYPSLFLNICYLISYTHFF